MGRRNDYKREKSQLDKLKQESAALESTVGELNKLRTDLERMGSRYVALTNDPQHCPLCRTDFPEGNVLKVISSIEI